MKRPKLDGYEEKKEAQRSGSPPRHRPSGVPWRALNVPSTAGPDAMPKNQAGSGHSFLGTSLWKRTGNSAV